MTNVCWERVDVEIHGAQADKMNGHGRQVRAEGVAVHGTPQARHQAVNGHGGHHQTGGKEEDVGQNAHDPLHTKVSLGPAASEGLNL